jgi:hypothetical protein
VVLEALLGSSLGVAWFVSPELVVLEGAVRSGLSLWIGVSSNFG